MNYFKILFFGLFCSPILGKDDKALEDLLKNKQVEQDLTFAKKELERNNNSVKVEPQIGLSYFLSTDKVDDDIKKNVNLFLNTLEIFKRIIKNDQYEFIEDNFNNLCSFLKESPIVKAIEKKFDFDFYSYNLPCLAVYLSNNETPGKDNKKIFKKEEKKMYNFYFSLERAFNLENKELLKKAFIISLFEACLAEKISLYKKMKDSVDLKKFLRENNIDFDKKELDKKDVALVSLAQVLNFSS